MKKTKENMVEVPAPAKAESSRPAAAAPASKTAGPVMSTAPPKAEGPRPLMSADLPRPAEPDVVPGDRFKGAVQSSSEFADKSDGAFISRFGNAEELSRFKSEIEARREREKVQARQDTFWRCGRCGRQWRAGMDWDGRKNLSCNFCNPFLRKDGSMMVQLTTPAEIDGFIAREKREKAAWAASLAKAKEIAKRLEQERTLLGRHGL